MALLSLPATAVEQELGRSGLAGGDQVGILETDGMKLSFVGHAGYGFLDSTGPVAGAHHGLYGNMAAGLHLMPQFSAALGVKGVLQFHPEDEFGKDKSILGEPWLLLRSGIPLRPNLLLGGEIGLMIPGTRAPSLEWSALILDMAALLTVRLSSAMTLAAKGGFRLDQSEKAAPDLAHTRYGDRISFPLSSYHAVLAGVLWMYQWTNVSVWTELSADFLVGNDGKFATSPMRFGAGGRYHVTRKITLHLNASTSLSRRPILENEDFVIPIEPRFLVLVGAGVTLDFSRGTSSLPRSQEEIEPVVTPQLPIEPKDETLIAAPREELETGSIASVVLDSDGLPVAGANVTVSAGESFTATVKTNREGRFEIDNVPSGVATMTIQMPFFETREQTVEVAGGQTWAEEMPPLQESEVGSQIRGLVRNFEGSPIDATITVNPGGAQIEADDTGEFLLDVEPGKYVVVIEAHGYKTQRRRVKVGKNSVEILNVELRKK
ncbi:MAG: carboxypeptidase regulatory-like domain-containing protein [Deltaproteobacteria bacterium]|nr:carboxypeptidase regulatory-like domain-containing protein [Deltaproteobacteria bacterium]